jgi:hypothetical protein
VFFTLFLDHGWKLSGGNLGIEIGTTTTKEKKKPQKQKKRSPDTNKSCGSWKGTSTTLDCAVANWRIPLK